MSNPVADKNRIKVTALTQAVGVQVEASAVGFDFYELAPVVDKIHEELDELMVEVHQSPQDRQKMNDELGDLLFAVVNLARYLNIAPEQALNRATAKFQRRFEGVKVLADAADKSIREHSLTELEGYWQQIKRGEG